MDQRWINIRGPEIYSTTVTTWFSWLRYKNYFFYRRSFKSYRVPNEVPGSIPFLWTSQNTSTCGKFRLQFLLVAKKQDILLLFFLNDPAFGTITMINESVKWIPGKFGITKEEVMSQRTKVTVQVRIPKQKLNSLFI